MVQQDFEINEVSLLLETMNNLWKRKCLVKRRGSTMMIIFAQNLAKFIFVFDSSHHDVWFNWTINISLFKACHSIKEYVKIDVCAT